LTKALKGPGGGSTPSLATIIQITCTCRFALWLPGRGDGFQRQSSYGSILETKASTILEFFAGLRGTLSVTFEEGTWAAWLYDLLKPHVAKVVVCNPRKNALLKGGNKSDRIDARKLGELLRLDNLKAVYHGETGVRMLRELARSYLTILKDLTRVMNRLKAMYRSWAIPCAGRDVYYTRPRTEWLGKIREAGVRRRAETSHEPIQLTTRSLVVFRRRAKQGREEAICDRATDSR
jgi:hypothetical protein